MPFSVLDTVKTLGPTDADTLRTFLLRDPVNNLYLLGLLEEYGVAPQLGQPPFAFLGRFKARELVAVIFVGGEGGLVVPSASSPLEISAIAATLQGKVRIKSALGEKSAVDAAARLLGATRPRLNRNQGLFKVSADDLGPFTNPTLRLATEADLPDLLPLAAGAVREALDQDPLAENPDAFKARVLHRIRARRTYVLWSDQRLVFKIDVGSRSPHGAELEGLYTLPSDRRRGHATLSLGQISRQLLSSLPRLTLRVDEQDALLGGVARKVGYIGGASCRLIVVD